MTQTKKQATFTKDLANKKITVVREFDGSVEDVWEAWTDCNLLDQWWAPSPWKTVTKTMDFKEGGKWLYCMQGPEGEKQWCRADYKKIVPGKSYTAVDAFCDENGNDADGFPGMHWFVVFEKSGDGTKVTVEITFKSEEELNKILEMGFQEGFTMAHGNLDELLSKS